MDGAVGYGSGDDSLSFDQMEQLELFDAVIKDVECFLYVDTDEDEHGNISVNVSAKSFLFGRLISEINHTKVIS